MAQIALIAEQANAWRNWVSNFDNSYARFRQALSQLQAKQSFVARHPEWSNAYRAQMARGNDLAQQLNQLKQTRDRVASWLTSTGHNIGNAANSISDWFRSTFGLGEQLALAPAIYVGVGLAAAAAAVAAAAIWTNETIQFVTRMNTLQNLEARGYSAQDAANAVSVSAGDMQPIISQTGVFGIPWLYVGLGVAAFMVLPRVMDRVNG